MVEIPREKEIEPVLMLVEKRRRSVLVLVLVLVPVLVVVIELMAEAMESTH